ncbi:O-linked N-acetylglucosamine transferase [Entamoeba marina]
MEVLTTTVSRYISLSMYDTAYKLCKILHNQNPSNESRLQLATCLYHLTRYRSCLSHISILPPSDLTMHLYALCCLALQTYATGASQLQNYLNSHSNATLYYLLGELHYHQFHRSEALHMYQMALSMDSYILTAHERIVELGQPIYRTLNPNPSSMTEVETNTPTLPRRRLFQSELTTISMSDNNSETLDVVNVINAYLQAISAVAREDIQTATNLIQNLQPTLLQSTDGMELTTRVLCQQHKVDAAVAVCREAIKRDAHNIDIYPLYSRALKQAKLTNELHSLSEKANEAKWTWQAWCVSAHEASVIKDHSTAITCFEKALKINQNIILRLWYATELVDDKQYEDALHQFRIVTSINPGCATAWVGISRCSLALYKFEESMEAAIKAVELASTVDSLMNAGIVSMKIKKYQMALRYLKQVDSHIFIVECKLRQVVVMAHLGQLQNALSLAKELRNNYLNEVVVRMVYVRVLVNLGQKGLALEELNSMKDISSKYKVGVLHEIEKIHHGPEGAELVVFPDWISI